MNEKFPGQDEILVVLGGVSGSGKTTIGAQLAERLGVEFLEGDAFHPPENVAKMSQGTPLTDLDREPWLLKLNQELLRRRRSHVGVVLACSALRECYRDTLRRGGLEPHFVLLVGEEEVLKSRLATRTGHFMPPSLLKSQLATLELPDYGIQIWVDEEPQIIVERILETLKRASNIPKGNSKR